MKKDLVTFIGIILFFVAMCLMGSWEQELIGEWGFWVSFLILGIMGSPILIAEYVEKRRGKND